MKIKSFSNLFELAERQLQNDLKSGKIYDYNGLDIIDKAVFIREQLEKLKVGQLYNKKELRRIKYLKLRR